LKSFYLAFYKIRPDLISDFTQEDANSPEVYLGRCQQYSLNDFREYAFEEILGKRILTLQPKDIDLILRSMYQSMMTKTSSGNLALKDHKLIMIDH